MFYRTKESKGTGSLISGLIIGTLATLLVTTNKDRPSVKQATEKLKKGARNLKSSASSTTQEVKTNVADKLKQAKNKTEDKEEEKLNKKG